MQRRITTTLAHHRNNIGHRRLFHTHSTTLSNLGHGDQNDFQRDVIFTTQIGQDLLLDPLLNRGTAFTQTERDRLFLRGLLPPAVKDPNVQVARLRRRFDALGTDLDRYAFLCQLQDRNEVLFYRFLMTYIQELAPIVYTPTVGKACQQFGVMFRRPRGMYFTAHDKGEMLSMVYNYPVKEIDIIVVTDGGRILGLGDLGANGMGIPIGKLALYVAAGGINPGRVLPVMLDVGTNNQELLDDPFYLGIDQKRATGAEYFEIVDEFMKAVTSRWPNVLVQFEDFTSDKANIVLDKYRKNVLCFNDDIQGTGSVIVSGLLNALRATGKNFSDLKNQKIMVAGAGCAGLGVCSALVAAMIKEGASPSEAYKRFYVLDKDGLITQARPNLTPEQVPFAIARSDMTDGLSLMETMKAVKPDILLGISGIGGLFKEELIREMCQHVERPIIFPLSNPTSNSEASAQDICTWTEGKAIFASGSPFPPVTFGDSVFYPSQGNNMFIFPAVGLAASIAGAKTISDALFYTASKALANTVTAEQLSRGEVYPPVADIREVTTIVATAIVQKLVLERNAPNVKESDLADLEKFVRERMWDAEYAPIIYKQF